MDANPTPTAGNRRPIQTFTVENVSAAVFANVRRTADGTRTFHSCAFTRTYRTAAGERKRTASFDRADLPRLIAVAKQAADYLDGLTPPA